MTSEYILNLLKENCIFDGDLDERSFEYKIIEKIEKLFSFQYNCGISKCVIIPSGADFVIKIPFTGKEGEYEEYDEEEDKYYMDDEYRDFEGAQYGDGNDYCFSEVVLYNMARHERVQKAFCKTKVIGNINGQKIYMQERATPLCSCNKKNFKEYSNDYLINLRKSCKSKGYSVFNTEWIALAIDYYGEKIFNKIMTFIKENGIDDLHNENIGFIGNRPVILDYAGWND